MAENTSTLTIELNTTDAQTAAANLAAKVALVGSNLAVTLAKFTEFQSKLNAINAKVNINVNKINDIVNVQQAVDAYLATKNLKSINLKVNAKLVVDKVTDINQTSIDKAVKAFNSTVPIARTKVNILSDATIEVAKIVGEVKGLPQAMRAFNSSAPIAGKSKVSVLADATIEVAKIVGEPKGIQAAMKAYNATAPIARQKISLIADASVSVMKIVGTVQGVAAAMRDFNRSVPITTSLIKVWADAKLFIMNVTGIDGSSIRDAIRNRTTPIEITTPITVVAKRIRIIADPTANVTVIIGQLQAAGAATESVTNKTNQWYRKILDVYLIYRVFDSVMSRIQHLWETGLHLAQIETTMSVITGSLAEANKQTEWLMETSNQIGLNFSNAAGPYAKFAAAAKGMFTSTEIKQMYIDLGKVAVAMHLNKEETNGVFLAIQQMASKGTVSLEELRLQFAERIPGAIAIAAASAGMTMTEFTKKVSSGDLGSSFLKKFLTDLSANFATASELAANSFIGMQSRFENAMFSMTASIATSGFMQAVGAILEDVAKFSTENKKAFEYLGILIGDTITSVYNDLKKMFAGADFVSALVNAFYAVSEAVKSYFDTLSTLQPVMYVLIKAFQLFSAAILMAAHVGESFKLVFLEIEKLLGYNVQDSIDETVKTMNALENKMGQVADSLFDLSATKIDLSAVGAVTELRKLQAEIKVTESDYKLLSDKFALTIKASKSSFTPTANETVTQSIKQGIDVATPENIDKLNSKVKDSIKNITELGDTVDRLNFDQKGKSLADSLSEYLQLANPDLAKDGARLQKEFNILKESLKLTPEDFQPRQVAGKFSEVLDEELASAKVKADILKGNLETAQADLSRTSAEIDSRIADLQGKRSKLVSTGRGSTSGDPEYAKQLDSEINKLKEYKSATEGLLTTQIGRLQGEFKVAVDRGNKLDTLLKELLSVQDKSTEGLTANANKLFESQSKITTELEKELGIRDEMVNKTNDLIRKEEQRKKILAIETGNAPERTLEDLVKARYVAQQELDRAMQEHKKLAEDAAESKRKELQTSNELLQVLKSQNAVEGLKALASEKTAASAEVQANVSISTEGMSSNAKDFMEKYKNELAKAAKELNVSPALIAAQAALETGYGKQMVAGTNNLFNVKDFSGKGVKAVDNQTKSNDPYKKNVDMQASFDDYVAKLKRQWPDVVGAQTPEAFGTALKPGKQGGFAEDINYVEKLTNVAKNFGIVSKTNSSITKEATKTQTELNKSYVVSEEVLNKSFKNLEDKADIAKDLENQIIKASEARTASMIATMNASKDLESGKLAKFDAAQAFQLQGSSALPEVQKQIDEAKSKLEAFSSLAEQFAITKSQLAKNLAGGGVSPEETNFWVKALDEANISLNDFTREASTAKSELEGLTQAKNQFAKLILDEVAGLEKSTQAMVDELQYGADYVERLRLSKISPELTIAFDKNKTTRDFLDFAKSAGTSVDGLKDTFASVFIAMGDTTKSFTESIGDLFDNMVNRMLDASAKLMANGLLDWFQGIQGGGTNAILGAIGTAVSLGVKFLTQSPKAVTQSTAQLSRVGGGAGSMAIADVSGRTLAYNESLPAVQAFNMTLQSATGNLKTLAFDFISTSTDFGKAVIGGTKTLFSNAVDYVSNLFGAGASKVEAATTATTEVFGSTLAKASGAVAILTLGYNLLSIAGNKNLDVIDQFGQSLGAAGAAATGLALAANSLGGQFLGFSAGPLAIAGAALEGVSLAIDIFKNGLNIQNGLGVAGMGGGAAIGFAFGGPFGAAIGAALGAEIGKLLGSLFMRTPNAWMNTFSSKSGTALTDVRQQQTGDNAALWLRDTNKGGFIGIKTAFGDLELSVHELAKFNKDDLVNSYGPLLKTIAAYDTALASSITAVDTMYGQSGTLDQFMSKLWNGVTGTRIASKQDLSGMDTAKMTLERQAGIADLLGQTDTVAGKTYSVWYKAFSKSWINAVEGDSSLNSTVALDMQAMLAYILPDLSKLPLAFADLFSKSVKSVASGATLEEAKASANDLFSGWTIAAEGLKNVIPDFTATAIPEYLAGLASVGLNVQQGAIDLVNYASLYKDAGVNIGAAFDSIYKGLTSKGLSSSEKAAYFSSSALIGGVAKNVGATASAQEIDKLSMAMLDTAKASVQAAVSQNQQVIAAEGLTKLSHEAAIQQLYLSGKLDKAAIDAEDLGKAMTPVRQAFVDSTTVVYDFLAKFGLTQGGMAYSITQVNSVGQDLIKTFGDAAKAAEVLNTILSGVYSGQELAIQNLSSAQTKFDVAAEAAGLKGLTQEQFQSLYRSASGQKNSLGQDITLGDLAILKGYEKDGFKISAQSIQALGLANTNLYNARVTAANVASDNIKTPSQILAEGKPVTDLSKSGDNQAALDYLQQQKDLEKAKQDALDKAKSDAEQFAKQQAENAKTFLGKQEELNAAIADFAASDANKKIMAVNKEMRGLEDAVSDLGQGALQGVETLKALKLGQVYKEQFDSVKPLLEISNKLGFTNLNLATAITKDEKGLWSFSQAALDLIPALHNVISNIDAYKASLEALNAAQDTVVKAGMGNIESSVKEIIQNLNADMLKLNSTPELNTQANRGLLVQAANTKGLETIKSYIDEFNNLGLNTYSKSVSGVNKEFGDLAKGLIAMAKELNWTQDQVDYATNAWNELRNARIDELNKKLTDSLKAVYTTFTRLDATSLENELYGLSDSFTTTIKDIVENGATLQQAAAVINIALQTGTRAYEKAVKDTNAVYQKNYKDMVARYIDISDTIAANAAKAKLDASLASLSLVDPTDKAYNALAAGSAQAQYESDMLTIAMGKQQRAVEKLNASQYKSTMTTDEANQAYQDQMDAVNTLIQLTNDRYTTEVDNYKRLADAAKGIRDFIKQFKLSDLATLSPEAKLAEARAQYSTQLVAAQAGDTTAMGAVTGAFNTYAEAAKAYYASTTPYQDIIAQGISDLSKLGAPETIDISEKIATATQTTADRLRILQDVLKGINEQQTVRLSNDLNTLRASTEKVGQQFVAGMVDLAATYGISAGQLQSAVMGQGITAATFLGSSSESLKTIVNNTSPEVVKGAITGALASTKTTAAVNTPDQQAVNDMTKTFFTKIQNDSLLSFSKSEAYDIYTRIAKADENSSTVLTKLSTDSLLAFSAAKAEAIYVRIAEATEKTVIATQATAHNLISLGEVIARLHYGLSPDPAYKPIMFASGGTFNKGVVDRPTAFNMGVMGEAGPEGILPLTNVGGKLGVHATTSDSSTAEAVIESGKANTEELRRMREETTALQKEMIAKLSMLERRMAQIESAGALVGAM